MSAALLDLPELKVTDRRVLDFIQVICNQHDGLVDNGWQEIWCHEDDSHVEAQRMSPAEFAAHVIELGWGIIDLELASAICPECQNAESTLQAAPGMLDTDMRIDQEDSERDSFPEQHPQLKSLWEVESERDEGLSG